MLEFLDEVVQFKRNDKTYEVRKPNNLEVKEYTIKLQSCSTMAEQDDALKELLLKLGLEESVYNALLPHHLNKLVVALYGAEKN
ncbi:MAG: hypothetical protein KDH96_06200 [Candidatus Riesia sp.]|nr:hypothetical protein [Candidatus Riesia sp.]